MKRLGIIGATTWGTTLAIIAAREGLEISLLVRSDEEADKLKKDRENRRFVPGFLFPPNVKITEQPNEALANADAVIFAVPSPSLRDNAQKVKNQINERSVVVSAVKGLEIGTSKRMSQILEEELCGVGYDRICALSGPNLAGEIVQGKPSSTVVASINEESSRIVQTMLASPRMRVYTNPDIIGVEIAGSMKNVTAIAVGISDGLGLGANAKASLITRGLSEISKLGSALGANRITFSGLAGMGDLIATCSSELSRNGNVGRMLASGKNLEEITSMMNNVAEGIVTTKAVISVATQSGVDVPLSKTVYKILFNDVRPMDALESLMLRSPTSE